MLVAFTPILVVDTKLIYGDNFVVPLNRVYEVITPQRQIQFLTRFSR